MTDTTTKETSAPPDQGGSLWTYTNKPAHAARVESVMATPSHDVHYAQIDKALLGGSHSPIAQKGGRVELALPNGTKVPVVIDKTEKFGEEHYVSEGTVEGDGHGRVVFAYNQGEMSAVLDDMNHGSWQIRSIGNSTSQVFKVDGTMVPPCDANRQQLGNEVVQAQTAPAMAGDVIDDNSTQVTAPQEPTTNTWGNTQVRILVPYSKVIETVMSPAAIRNTIDLAIAALNNDLSRSAVPVSVVLVGAPGVQYNQEWDSTNGATLNALTRVANSIDGVMDEIHVMRADTQADLVCFALCQIDPSYSGVGYILSYPWDAFNTTYGFSVVNFWYINSNSTFSHEIGHNLGCNHDRENARSSDGTASPGTYSYSYGYRFWGNNGQQYRTIMAYPPGNVIPYFSNPNLRAWAPISTPVGSPLGGWTEAYNALTITQNAMEVSYYHTSRLVTRTAKRIRGY